MKINPIDTSNVNNSNKTKAAIGVVAGATALTGGVMAACKTGKTSAVADAVGEKINSIKSSKFVDSAIATVKKAAGIVADGLKKVFSPIADVVKNAYYKVKDSFFGLIDKITGGEEKVNPQKFNPEKFPLDEDLLQKFEEAAGKVVQG